MQHSNYWLDKELFADTGTPEDRLDVARIARLAAVRRAIANFVNILSGKNVPVEYSSGKQSYTDGERVVISAEDDPAKFDVMVGLALHEGSHVLLTDFTFLQGLAGIRQDIQGQTIPTSWTPHNRRQYGKFTAVSPSGNLLNEVFPPSLLKVLGEAPTRTPNYNWNNTAVDAYWASMYWERAEQMFEHLQTIMNILEDRRIDKYVYQNAQGYRPYYTALYDRYFFTAEIGKNLRFNPEWRTPTIENYINRLLFAFHPAAKQDAMPGLSTLYQMLNMQTIERLAPTTDLVHLTAAPTFDSSPALWQEACHLYAHILSLTGLAIQQGHAPEPEAGSVEQQAEQSMSDLPNLDHNNMEPVPVEKDVKGKDKQEVDGKFNEKKAQKEVQDALKVMNSELKKKALKKSEKDAVDALEKANAQVVDIKGDGIKDGKCIVTRKVTQELLEQDWFIFGTSSGWTRSTTDKAIAAGRRMGAILHHRLQVRNDPIVTKQTRLPHGGLDRRLLAQLGMEITSVFQKSRTESHKPVVLHLSLDASGSMSGKKWDKVLTVAVAVAYLSSKLQNVDAVISVRGGYDLPMVAILFDSRKDQLANFLKLLRFINPAGSTPEGLCFKATMELVLEQADTHDVYFINFSDGEPTFSWKTGRSEFVHYGSDFAATHTRKQIRTMREAGVRILSYFISEGGVNHNAKRLFNIMYGEDASFVDVQNAGDVLRTLNKLLLKRGS